MSEVLLDFVEGRADMEALDDWRTWLRDASIEDMHLLLVDVANAYFKEGFAKAVALRSQS